MTITQNIDNFMQKIYNNQNHRYTSWEICYKAFGDININDEVKALHLAGYLASWGMYRGSSNLLRENNYMIFNKLVPILNEYMDLRKDFLEENDYDRFLNFVKRIKESLEKKNITSTNTLTTKIILGVYGCFPALDDYFKKGFNSYNNIKISINQKKTFKNFYNNLKNFYFANKGAFETKKQEIKANRSINYPPMKLVDMYFWEYGNMLKELEKIKKRLENES